MKRLIHFSLCFIVSGYSLLLGSDYAAIPVDPTHLDFSAIQDGPLPVAQSVIISGPGDSWTIDWSLSDDADWLDEDPASGSVQYQQSVSVSVNTTTLPPGIHDATITFTSPKGDTKQDYVTVEYEIFEGPARVEARYYPSDWFYTQDSTIMVEFWVQSAVNIQASQIGFRLNRFLFRIDTAYWNEVDMNIEIDVLSWGADTIVLGNVSGIFPPNDPMFEASSDPLHMATMEMTFKADSIFNLPAWFYCDSSYFPPAGDFIFTDTAGYRVEPEYVTDTLYLQYSQDILAHIHLNPTQLIFNALHTSDLPVSQSFQITNLGSDVLNWSIADDAGWLDEWPLMGQSNSEEITVDVNTTGLTPGEYNALITVTGYNADNSPQYVYVDYNLYPCGDANCSMQTNVADMIYVLNYLYVQGPEPCPFIETGDVDMIPGISHNDAQLINNFIFLAGDPPYCPPFADSLIPVSGDTVEIITRPINPHETEAVIEIWLKAKEELQALALPFEYTCSEPGLVLDSIVIGPDLTGESTQLVADFIDSVSNKAAIGYANIGSYYGIGPGDILIATLYFKLQDNPGPQFIHLDTTHVDPSNRYIFTRWEGMSFTTDAFLPVFLEYICGDANNDGVPNISDAVWMLNFVFLGGPPPIPLNSAEVNCDGVANVSDVVWLLNYIFFPGAPGPCDC